MENRIEKTRKSEASQPMNKSSAIKEEIKQRRQHFQGSDRIKMFRGEGHIFRSEGRTKGLAQ